MKIVALVGESGTGKTTIAEHLRQRGARHIAADRIAHEILCGNPDVRGDIRRHFGEGVFGGGDVDRKKLAKAVFGDPAALAVLNGIIHPRVLGACEREIEESKKEGVELVVVDAALLLDVTIPFRVDLVIGLRASRDEQVLRLVAKGGFTEEEIIARLDSQGDLEKSFDQTDVVLDTDKPLSRVLAEVDELIDDLMHTRDDAHPDG